MSSGTAFDSVLASSKSLLILLPTNPQFDHVAAGLSLFSSLQKAKRNVVISCPTPMIVEFNRLVNVDKITAELGERNLIIRFLEYPVDSLETVSYDIVDGEIRIKVEPKGHVLPPKKEQVHVSYAGAGADTVILIGGGHESHFPALSQPDFKTAKFIHIGTRVVTLAAPLEALSLAQSASSTSEVVANLIKQNSLPMDADIATNLLMGIEEGSRGFSSSETNAETFALIAELLRLGGKRFTKQQQPQRGNFPPGAIPNAPFTQAPSTPQPQQQGQPGQRPPKSWYEPKIYKGSGTPVS